MRLLILLTLPYWPGGDGRYASSPIYEHRIVVIDSLGGSDWYDRNLREAIAEWNRCGADVHLVEGDRPDFTPQTITVVESEDGGAYGGWSVDHGVVFLGDSWTRSDSVIAHELGHALGFGHNQRTSVMGNGGRVQPIDCQGLRSYYR